VRIGRPEEDPGISFYERLDEIIEGCDKLAEATGLSYEFLAANMLVADGWTWNRDVFRAPIWMLDHREFPVEEARKMRGLQWLKGTSEEIRSKQIAE